MDRALRLADPALRFAMERATLSDCPFKIEP
jgi:hypothetical protein